MGLGAPVSWTNLASVAPRTTDSPRREAVIRDTFLDEGGWIGITAFPHMWSFPVDPIDLVYISGLKMNVSNFGTAGHQFFDVPNVLIENSHYGWSKNTRGAIDPVQYVRQRFLEVLSRQPDPAAHFYWSDLLIRHSSQDRF